MLRVLSQFQTGGEALIFLEKFRLHSTGWEQSEIKRREAFAHEREGGE